MGVLSAFPDSHRRRVCYAAIVSATAIGTFGPDIVGQMLMAAVVAALYESSVSLHPYPWRRIVPPLAPAQHILI